MLEALVARVVAGHRRSAVGRMREAERLIMKRNHALTAVVFTLMSTCVSTVVVHSGCRKFACRLRLHGHVDELQHVQQVVAFQVTDQGVDLEPRLPVIRLRVLQGLRQLIYDVLRGPQVAHCELLDLLDQVDLVAHQDLVVHNAALQFKSNGSGGLQSVLLM